MTWQLRWTSWDGVAFSATTSNVLGLVIEPVAVVAATATGLITLRTPANAGVRARDESAVRVLDQ
jgi:hypothetical protein